MKTSDDKQVGIYNARGKQYLIRCSFGYITKNVLRIDVV